MKTVASSLERTGLALVATLVLVAGCNANHHIGTVDGDSGGASQSGGAGGGPAKDAGTVPEVASDDGGPSVGFDPGSAGIRRLSDAEYARTLADLLGLDASPPNAFGDPDVLSGGLDSFDNLAAGTSISAARYEAYFENAAVLVQQAFASDTLRARIVTCAPASATDDACASGIVRAFGRRAWRRPLTDGEVADLVALVRADLTAGDDFASAIQQAIVALLASESFLYRIERDPPPPDASVHLLTSYELASRLSYLLWSTMPDEPLFALAATDDLQKPDVLSAQVTRMLADARSDGLVRNFFGQWLGFRALTGPLLDRPAPAWSAPLQASMAEEARLFVSEIVQAGGGIGDLLTADVSFVDARLATFYGLPAPTGTTPDAFSRTVVTSDAREGYLGLGAFLAVASEGHEASRFPRGVAIDENILCLQVPAPPTGLPPALTGTPRQQYDDVQAMAGCADCHQRFESLGLGLENFDQIGQFRTTYPGDATTIDATGALPDGTPFNGVIGLAALLGKDLRFSTCARREALVYTLGRALADTDAGRLAAIDARWSVAGNSVRGLLAAIVVDDIFRYRRGEGQP